MELGENIEDIGIVTNIHDSVVTIELKKSGACDNCAMNGICMGKNAVVTHEVRTDISLEIGDSVRIFIQPKYKILSAFLLFIFPILLMIITYLFSFYYLQLPEKSSIIVTLSSLVLSGFILFLLDKKLKNQLQVKIIEKVSQE